MIIEVNESKTLTVHKSYECKCKFDTRKCKSNQKWSVKICKCECKNMKKHRLCEKDYIWNPATCSCKNGKYLASIIDDSVITCDETIHTRKTVPTNFNEKKVTCRIKSFILYLPITIALLIAVNIYFS